MEAVSDAGYNAQMRGRDTYYVYIMASGIHGTLYVGMTNDIVRRAQEHRDGLVEGFTKKYGVKRLVYFEEFATPADAIRRETRIKKYRRSWKINLILGANPEWDDLAEKLFS